MKPGKLERFDVINGRTREVLMAHRIHIDGQTILLKKLVFNTKPYFERSFMAHGNGIGHILVVNRQSGLFFLQIHKV